MKSRTSFFDPTVLKKDITRFFPVWGLYLIGGLLISQSVVGSSADFRAARTLVNSLQSMAAINCGYGAVIVWLLFGDLYKSRMCNALHALPVRRECWFVTHTVAALLMSIVPNMVMAVLMMPYLGTYWYTALLWLGVMTLEFLFFYALACFAALCTGNRLAAVLVYAVLNFGAMLVMWLAEEFIYPLLPGLELRSCVFSPFSPVVHLMNQRDFWTIVHDTANCRCEYVSTYHDHIYYFSGPGESWGYLWILAGLSLALLAASLWLYRSRKLECAGDFAAVKPVHTLISVVGAVFAGMLFLLFGEGDHFVGYFLLAAGMLVGFFGCRMLLERKVKVFSGKNWLRLVALYGAFALCVTMAAVDLFGVVRRIPKLSSIKQVTISQSYLSENRLNQINANPDAIRYPGDQTLTLTQPDQIEKVMKIHSLLLDELDKDFQDVTPVTIHYQLKSGATMTRYYYGYTYGAAIKLLQDFTNTPAYIFGTEDVERIVQTLDYLFIGEYGEVADSAWQEKIVRAMFADAQAGNLGQDYYTAEYWVELQLRTVDEYHYLSIRIPRSAKQTLQCLQDYAAWYKDRYEQVA